jgi:hypothetical protein
MRYAQPALNWIVANRANTPGTFINETNTALNENFMYNLLLGLSPEDICSIDEGYMTSEMYHGLDKIVPRKMISMFKNYLK